MFAPISLSLLVFDNYQCSSGETIVTFQGDTITCHPPRLHCFYHDWTSWPPAAFCVSTEGEGPWGNWCANLQEIFHFIRVFLFNYYFIYQQRHVYASSPKQRCVALRCKYSAWIENTVCCHKIFFEINKIAFESFQFLFLVFRKLSVLRATNV